MKKIIILMLVSLAFFACTKKPENEIYVYNWSEYIPDEVIKQFEKETGIKVRYTTYDSNEAMYAKIKITGGADYDIAVPSTYYVQKMQKEGLIQAIDTTKLTNFSKLNPQLINQPYDPENKYSVPFMWGTTAIGVNAKYIDPATISSWADLWREEFKGKVMLQNDLREVFHAALHSLGYSGNTKNKDELEAAYNKLVKLMPSVKLFNSDSPRTPFLNEEVYIGIMWSGEAFMAAQENENIKYIYPKDGAAVWVDSLVIPSKAKNVENAYKFIDFIIRPDISAQISNYVGYTTPVKKEEVSQYLDETSKNSRTIFPTDDDLKKSEFQLDVENALPIYSSFWEKLKIGE